MVVAEGGKAVLLDVNEEAGAGLAHELGAAARFVKTDVTSEADGQAASPPRVTRSAASTRSSTARASRRARRWSAASPHSLDRFARAVSINLVGTFNMIRLAADAMSKHGSMRKASAA